MPLRVDGATNAKTGERHSRRSHDSKREHPTQNRSSEQKRDLRSAEHDRGHDVVEAHHPAIIILFRRQRRGILPFEEP